jgi:pyruvate dehydrogenase E2 component (dihydrolipoamide acetyltransferase)
MPTKVMMEALSPTMEEGRLVKWLRQVGDAVKAGDTLAEVETDKAIMELVARGEGVLRARLVEEGTTAPVGQVIGVIAGADEDIAALTGGASAGPSATSAAPPAAPAAAPATASVSAAAPAPDAPAADAPAPRSSPLARRLAAEQGIDLRAVAGSGPGGRVIRRDVEAAAATGTVSGTRAGAATTAPTAGALPAAPAVGAPPATSAASRPTALPAAMVIEGAHRDIPLTQMRKTIARRLAESIGPVPTFYLTAEIDMTAAGRMREEMTRAGDAFKVSVNDLVVKAVAIALTRHPELNAHWLGDSIRYFSAAHIGVAVATDDGLIVPVIRDAHLKGLGTIAREARDYATRARERTLAPAEYTGATFSVSNLGMFGIDQFTAIINPPEAAILAVGATETKPVWDGQAFVPRQRMRVTLSCDHRVIDGAVGARFLQTLRQLLEAPLLMLY